MSGWTLEHGADRRAFGSDKWTHYADDVLPMWVADMDFAAPQEICHRLAGLVEHGVFGYGQGRPPSLIEAIVRHAAHRYDWTIDPDWLVLLPALVPGLNIACRAVGESGDAVLVPTPVYPRFLGAVANQGRRLIAVPHKIETRGGVLDCVPDLEALAAACTPDTRLLLLCHPHNPTGRAYTEAELGAIAALAEARDLVVVSDEVHGDLALDGDAHRPLAVVAPRLAPRLITLMAPSKTYNIAGLGCGWAIIADPALRLRFRRAMQGLTPAPNLPAMAAAEVALGLDDSWRQDVLTRLRANRERLIARLAAEAPMLGVARPAFTYLAWIDCSRAGIGDDPAEAILRRGRLALSDGRDFGPGGEGFVRLNFGCSAATLEDGIGRLLDACRPE